MEICWSRRFSKGCVTLSANFRRKGPSPSNHCLCQKKMITLSRGIKIFVLHCLILSQSTRVTDRQTDGRTDRIKKWRMLTCKGRQKVYGVRRKKRASRVRVIKDKVLTDQKDVNKRWQSTSDSYTIAHKHESRCLLNHQLEVLRYNRLPLSIEGRSGSIHKCYPGVGNITGHYWTKWRAELFKMYKGLSQINLRTMFESAYI